MAAAVDWVDAYRAGDLEAIIGMYADDGVICCHCGSTKTLTDREALRVYWVDRLKRYPAFELDDIWRDSNLVFYERRSGQCRFDV
ncbi:nuclear transport factor 2 family protein [Bradyrhizobium sp. 13971]